MLNDECRMPNAECTDNQQSSNPQSAIRNLNRQSQSAISIGNHNRQSPIEKSAVTNLQSAIAQCLS
jgi:hypothetical protein